MDRILEKLKGYRTAIVNSGVMLAGVLVAFGVVPKEVADAITANTDAFIGALLAAIGAINVVLRAITDTKIGQSE